MHRAIGLDREQVGDLDRADLGHAAEIVAQQIDDHQILGALLLVHGEPGLEAGIFARRAAPGRGALHRPRRHVLALAAEEQLGRQRQHVELGRVDQRAIGHALLAPERGIERDRIALEGEAIFQGEIDLIDVAGGDVVLHRGEGAIIVLARPGQSEVGDLGRARRRRCFRARRACRHRRADGARRNRPIHSSGTRAVCRQQALELRLEAIAELVGEEARRMEPARQPRRDLVEGGLDLVRRVSGDDCSGARYRAGFCRRASDCRRAGHKGKRSSVRPIACHPLERSEHSPYGRSQVSTSRFFGSTPSRPGSASRPCRAPTCRPSAGGRGRRA